MKVLSICMLIWLSTIAIALLAAYPTFMDTRAIVMWPKVTGTIEVSQVAQMAGRYWPKLAYDYSVGGVAYTGRYVNYVDMMQAGSYFGSRDAEWPHDHVAPYPVGKQVSVHYDPAKPGRSLLVATPISYWQCVPFWGFILQLIGAAAVMQRLFVTRKGWLVLSGLLGMFTLWVCFFIAAAPA